MNKEMYNIDRKTAARLLKVSVRTVDRYVTSKKISIQKRDSRIWLNKKEILRFKRSRSVDMSSVVDSHVSIDNGYRQSVDTEATGVDILSTPVAENFAKTKQKTAGSVYEKLYEETYNELKSAQERLEGANYRVGQLEATLAKSVPLLEHQRLLGEEKAQNLEMEERTETLRDKLEKYQHKLKSEEFLKKIYLIALFILLVMQPLWLLIINAN